jgi:hypothetical protein
VNWRVLRHLMIVFGAYYLAMSVHGWLVVLQPSSVTGEGNLGWLWVHIAIELPRAIVGVFATVMIWYALGPAVARRWVWGLAIIFGLLRGLAALNTRFKSPVPHLLPDMVGALVPVIACVITGLVLQRLLPEGPGDEAVREEPTPRRGRTIAMTLTLGALMLAFGGFLGVSLSGYELMHSAEPMAVFFQQFTIGRYAEMQFRSASYDEAKRALEHYLKLLDSVKPMNGQGPQPCASWLASDSSLDFDRAATYARLAVAAGRAQRPDEEAAYWTHAIEYASKLHWKDSSPEAIRHKLEDFIARVSELETTPVK